MGAAALTLRSPLLFVAQPMFTRMVLPMPGGAPTVWNTCVMWFQGVLLVGYLYAHLINRALPVKAQVLVHAAC